MSTHIGAAPGEIAETVLMPGDPYRARWAAETFLDTPRLVNEVRGMLGYTGTWKGHPVTIHGSGMGMPSLSIYAHELIRDHGAKTLIRIGGGNLKSIVVFVFLGIAAYMTLRGLFGAFRVGVLEQASVTFASGQDLPSLLGVHPALPAALIGGALIAYAYASKDFRSSFDYTLGGVVTGLVVMGGWVVSGVVGYVQEHPETLQEAFVATNTGRMESFSFVSPMAYTLEYLMFWTDASKIVTISVADPELAGTKMTVESRRKAVKESPCRSSSSVTTR